MIPFIDLNGIVQFSLLVAPIASGITELIKRNFEVPKKLLPYICMGIGIVAGLVYPANFNLITRIVGGALAGLSGVGAFEAFFKNIKSIKLPSTTVKK